MYKFILTQIREKTIKKNPIFKIYIKILLGFASNKIFFPYLCYSYIDLFFTYCLSLFYIHGICLIHCEDFRSWTNSR